MHSGLPHDGLVSRGAHGPFVVDDLVQIRLAWRAVEPEALHQGARARATTHAVAKFGRVWQHGGDEVAWRYLDTSNLDRLGAVEAEAMQGTQHLNEVFTEAVLKRDAIEFEPARHQHHFFVLYVDATQRADVFGEHKHLGLAERRRGEQAAAAFPDKRRVETFFDGGPNAERGGELESVDHQVAAIAHTHFGDLAEQMIAGVTSQHVGQSGLHTHRAQ